MNGFIKLHLKFLEWEWYKDINTKTLFIHCLLKANRKDKKFKNVDVKRGGFITSIINLSKETGLTIQQTRTALRHLQSTNELTIETTSQFTLITINNYELYQCITNNLTNNQQTINMPPNNQLTTTKDIYIYLTSYLERIYARVITSLEAEKMNKWIEEDQIDYRLIQHAIDISVNNGAKNINYIESILRNWKTNNLKTYEEVLEKEAKFKAEKEKFRRQKAEEENKPVENLFEYNWVEEQ